MFPHQEPCGARGKRRGFSPADAARHSQQARVHTDSRQKSVFNNRKHQIIKGKEFDKKIQSDLKKT